MTPSNPGNELAKRLAEKAGLSEEQANKFIEALLSLIVEEQESSSVLGLLLSAIAQDFTSMHTITIPMEKHPDGIVKVNPDEIPLWFPGTVKPTKGVRPPAFAHLLFGGGGYAGSMFKKPYARIVIDPGNDPFDFDKLDFSGLSDALTKAISASDVEVAFDPGVPGIGKLDKE
jgi:hypothetical protein